MGTDVVVIGAGVVGAACAYYLARAGASVTIVDRAAVAGGTSGRGEGNLLVSDKSPGPELALALRSLSLWESLDSTLDGSRYEYERKGGLVVAATAAGLAALRSLAADQEAAGVTAAAGVDPRAYESFLRPDLAGAVFYPQDCQVQPMLAAACLVQAAVALGATLRTGCTVTGIRRASTEGGAIVAVETAAGPIATKAVVNASGTWASDVAKLAGLDLPILPRRGFILVTEPLPQVVRHKVYAAEYVANVASSASDLQTSAVIEGTRAGTVLIGSSRERVGFDASFPLPVLARIAAQAVGLFPVLGNVHALRAYRGFRPYTPDHLPVIGADPRVPGLLHACGHEGAGVGLAPATAELVTAALAGSAPPVDPYPFRPSRFGADDG
jgi:glycine/D-amino acid oxidase-like deaminating enzyme